MNAPSDAKAAPVWILLLGPVTFVLLLAAPLSLPAPAHRLAAVMGLVVVWWVTEAVPLAVTALLGPCLAVLLGLGRAREVFAPFGDPVIFLFLGSFLLAEALHVHGLDRRLALFVLALPGISTRPGRVPLALGLVTAAVSMWISNTATAAMMLPIALGIVRALDKAGARQSPATLLITVGIAASVGGVATPVGSPPNLIALGFLERHAGVHLDFLTFMAIGVPVALAMLLVLTTIGRWRDRHEVAAAGVDGEALMRHVRAEQAALPRWSTGDRTCMAVFVVAVVLWLLPGVVGLAGLRESALGRLAGVLDEAVVALCAGGALFVLPIGGGRRALAWSDAQRIDWGTLMLFGGGLALGKLMFDTGLAEALGRGALAATGVSTLWGLTALALLLTIVLTEVASNAATVSMLAPLVIALAREIGVSVVPPLLAVGFGASLGFMFPAGTPPNALVYGTGLVPLTAMMRIGVIVDLIGFFVVFATLRVLCPLLGLA
ncbi:MAG: SLC13 family permease [Vicinamibacteria bacterium]|nr:SLC13 family permease [Vicinamibacteria bacterium]